MKVGEEGDNRGWDDWMASLTRWTWVWVSSGSWWWTGRPGVPQSMGSQRVRHDWVTELTDWLFMGFSRQEYWSGLPISSPVDHVLSELSTMTCPSCVALHSMTDNVIEFQKAVIHVIILVSFLWLWFSFWGSGITVLSFSVCLPMDENKRLVQAFWWDRLAVGKPGSYSGGQHNAQ